MSDSIRLGEFELVVLLAVIRLDNNAYGASIIRLLVSEIGRDVSIGALYATTERLKDKGLLTSKAGDPTPERGGRAKNFLQITAKGLAAVSAAKATLDTLWAGLDLCVAEEGVD